MNNDINNNQNHPDIPRQSKSEDAPGLTAIPSPLVNYDNEKDITGAIKRAASPL